MAIFYMNINPIKRSAGQQATGAAAYRAGETIRDERTGNVHNYSRRKDVRHAEIILPSRFGDSPMQWARSRASLWNAAEAAEKRRTSRVAREFEVALPAELNPEQRLALARTFSQELADRYGVAVDLAIHDPKPGRESNNFHAHVLATTREVTETGLGAKTGMDMSGVLRAQQGLPTGHEEYYEVRKRWAELMNQSFREANIDARVDHRSLAAQGIDRKPLVHVPLEFYKVEQQGMPKEVAERLREEYRARVAAHLERIAATSGIEQATAAPVSASPARERVPSGLEQATPRPEQSTQETVQQPQQPQQSQQPITPRNAEEIRRRAVQAWLQMRSKGAESSTAQGSSAEPTSTRQLDKDGKER
jgi:hypothetical protein